MAPECHTLLKSLCSLKGVSVQDYVYGLIATEFAKQVRTDPQIRHMFMSGEYPEGSRARQLQIEIEGEFDDLI